jgi:uncharacterized protein with NAD-binding domain and iron-sulfur cluster
VPAPPRVVVLGGGIAGLAAAWELSRPEHRDDVASITVYQRGWRLGGKGASSRGPHGRIEEHGLHVWLGYYENAFRLVRECYAELDREQHRPDSPIRAWTDAFRPASTIGLGEEHDGTWLDWLAHFDENAERPGEPGADRRPLTPQELVQRSVRLLVNFAQSLLDRDDALVAPGGGLVISTDPEPPPAGSARVVGTAADSLLAAALASVSTVGLVTSSLPPRDDAASAVLLDAVDVVVERLRAALFDRVQARTAARRTWQFLDLVRAIVRGIVVDRLFERPEGYAAVDDVDYCEWLVRHGASDDTVRSPLVRVVYDLVFGYVDGDPERPRFAAGTGLLLSGKMFFDYRGAIFWKMTAGMGETVFTPLYEALRARGVTFRFFHRVDRLRLSADGARIDAIDLGVQAHLAAGVDAYEPLVDVGGLGCWPDRPRDELLEGTRDHAADDYESLWSQTRDVSSETLTAGRDFDAVVLAIPVGMHRFICGDLIDNPRTPQWRAMVDGLGTVATKAMQLWLRVDERALGWHAPDVTASGYPGAFHTYASMSELLAVEQWPADDAPATLAYFCDVLEADTPTGRGSSSAIDAADARRLRAQLRDDAVAFLRRDVGHLWPHAVVDGDFRWELLCGPEDRIGEARLDAQYLRANVDPSERYVLSLPGTSRLRLRADASGYENLWLAGDWTDNGLNAGCIEAAVVSGIQAANGVLGLPHLRRVAGYFRSFAATASSPLTPSARP